MKDGYDKNTMYIFMKFSQINTFSKKEHKLHCKITLAQIPALLLEGFETLGR